MGDFEQFRALSFDCYGTLIDWEAGLTAQLVPWAAGHGLSAASDDLLTEFARTETVVEAEHPAMPYPVVLATTLDRIAQHFGVSATAEERAAFGASVGAWPAFPDSAEALARLGERSRLIILSNVDRRSFAASNARLGIDFDHVITAEDVGSYKPDSRNFEALLAALGPLGVDRSELLHVAQSLYHDHEPARALGLPSVWIDRRHAVVGSGATPVPASPLAPAWRFETLAAFADAVFTS